MFGKGVRIINRGLHALSALGLAGCVPPIEKGPLFIIGSPRTGSTVLYQVLTHALEVTYINNLAQLLYGSLPLGMRLSALLLGDQPHACFESQHGSTRRLGGYRAPAECGSFWYRWLSKEDHFVGDVDENSRIVRHIRSEVKRAQRVKNAPFIFKNLNMGQRIRLIKAAFPNAKVIWCRRDVRFTVQSIIQARESMMWPENKLWSVKPKEWRDLEALDLVPQVCSQVMRIERQIDSDLIEYLPDNWAEVDYETWPKCPDEIISNAAKMLGARTRNNSVIPKLAARNKVSDEKLFERIETELLDSWGWSEDIFPSSGYRG